MAINILIHSLLSTRCLLQIEIPPDALTLAAGKKRVQEEEETAKG